MDYKQLPDELDINRLLEEKIYKPLRQLKKDIKNWLRQNWFKLAFLGVCTFFALKKDLNLNINLGTGNAPIVANHSVTTPKAQSTALSVSSNILPSGTSEATVSKPMKPVRKPIVMTPKVKKQLAYVKRFANVAQEEMRKFNIPASITLAQGLIETNAGASPLATKNNNHFGIKCFSKSCKKGHCSNFSDDSHKDFFRKYASSWESFRAHSKLLTYKRYKHLTKLDPTDYKGWALGLKKAGYATDKNYHNKLIRLIEDLHLDEYDQL
ncbi:MAG: glucosaminidase domain-containing protein [Bacteroidota bacterium]